MDKFENIFLTASGYDYFWQYGVLYRLSLEPGFEKIRNVFANSGGSMAIGYVNAVKFSPEKLKEICEWWAEYGGKPRSTKWWQENLMQHKDPDLEGNIHPKNYYVGVSKPWFGFSWEKFCPFDSSTYINAIRTSHIPGVTMSLNPIEVLRGVDGHWAFNPNKHLPNNKDKILLINAFGKVPVGHKTGDLPHRINRMRNPSKIIGKFKPEDHLNNFEYGVECAEDFLKVYK